MFHRHRALPLLPCLAFVSGFVLMVYELVAARVLAPTIGSSTYVWTSVIGVIIAMLSFGVWWGGRFADMRHRLSDIGLIFAAAALTVAVTTALYLPVLEQLAMLNLDIRLRGVVASFVLFAPTSFTLGLLGPYLAKMNVRSLEKTGESVANLDAMHALGGIVGTFLTGFVLFTVVGSRTIFFILLVLLLVAHFSVAGRAFTKLRWALLLATLLFAFMGLLAVPRGIVASRDTPSAHYEIGEITYDNRPFRAIASGPNGYQSGIDTTRPDDLVFWYTKEIAADVLRVSPNKRILVLGGGTLTLPRWLARTIPGATVDVVEIDAGLTPLARQWFAYDDPANVRIFYDDARTYIDQTTEKYDVVIVDLYNDAEVPFTTLTREYGASVKRVVKPGGTVAVNVIAGLSQPCEVFLQAALAPYAHAFSYGGFRMRDTAVRVSNAIAVFSSARENVPGDYEPVLTHESPTYTDDFSPSEALQFSCQER